MRYMNECCLLLEYTTSIMLLKLYGFCEMTVTNILTSQV